jgi:hypothetical protein
MIIIVIYYIDLRFITYKMPLTQTNSNTGLWEAFCKTCNVVSVIILLLLLKKLCLIEVQNREYSWRLHEVWSSSIQTECRRTKVLQVKEERTAAFRVWFKISDLHDVAPCNLSDRHQRFGVNMSQKTVNSHSHSREPQIPCQYLKTLAN